MSNVIPLQIHLSQTDYHDNLLAELGSKKARGIEIDLTEAVSLINLSQNYTKIRDWMIRERLVTKHDFEKLLRRKYICDEMGGDPKTPTTFLNLHCKKYNIKVDYKKGIKQFSEVFHAEQNVEFELFKLRDEIKTARPDDMRNLLEQEKLFLNILQCKTTNLTTEDLARLLRIKARELELRFTSQDIDDVIQEWIKQEQANRRFEIFSQIMHRSNPSSEDMWDLMIISMFDLDDKPIEVVKAVLKKLVRQVKRKILNMPVENHLMPIFIGPQGVGKSTWMKKFLQPLSELTASTDFRQITDDRNIDIWKNFVLILDEMGYASKADIDVVKNLITADKLLRRVMRSNNAITVSQDATFFGASNRDLPQLVYDETGMRRFIGLRFCHKPDWEIINSINMEMLWQSVDEYASDPLQPFQDVIKAEQEQERATSPCEEWALSLPKNHRSHNEKPSAFWYRLYRDWEKDFYQKRTMDYDQWVKEFKRLIHGTPEFPFSMHSKASGFIYRFLGGVEDS